MWWTGAGLEVENLYASEGLGRRKVGVIVSIASWPWLCMALVFGLFSVHWDLGYIYEIIRCLSF